MAEANRRRVLDGRRLMQFGCIAVLTMGGGLRLRQYLADRALWLDEIQLSLNIIHRSFSGLLRPLDSHQGAPVGWLWADKAVIEHFGNSEMALRFVPLVLSVGALALFFVLVQRWLVGIAQILACALFAFSPDLISYAAQVKQYGTDVFFVLLVVVLTTRVDDRPTKTAIALWALLSIIAMWCSHAAAIALAACALVLTARLVRRFRHTADEKPTLTLVFAAGVAFAVSFGTEYVVNLRAIADNAVLVSYWQRGTPPKPFGFGSDAAWLWRASPFLMTNPVGLAVPRLALVLFVAGIVLFVVRRGPGALIVVAPVVAAIVLALAGKYPLHERLALYLVPCVFIGLAALADLRRARLAPFAIAALVAVLFVAGRPMEQAASVVWRPTDITDSRGPFKFVAAHWQTGDALYIENPWSAPAYHYYAGRYHLHVAGTFGFRAMPSPCVVDPQFHSLRGRRRVWFVLTHRAGTEPLDRNAIYRSYFAAIGKPIAAFAGAGQAAAYLYTVVSAHVAVTRRPTWVENGCLSLARLRPADVPPPAPTA